MSDDLPDLYLGDAITGELARSEDVRIAMVTDFFDATTHEEITSNYLRVNYVVEGSTRVVDGQVNVVVRLFDMKLNEYLWRNTYVESLAEFEENESPLVS